MEDLVNELSMPKSGSSIITVIGVGGAGGNALNYMWNIGIKDVNFLACNTDQGALDNLDIPNENKIVMGPGLGAGNDPKRGEELAVEALPEIKQFLEARGTKMVFIAAGMGGGTGTGASPVIAKLAHDMGLLTVANVTSPLIGEGRARQEQAQRGIEELRKYADSLLVINNESIREMYGKLSIKKAFGKADDILAAATKGIAEIITVKEAFIRVDFADLERVMRGSGRAHMGVASAEGEGRAEEAARRSLCSPLLNRGLISGAKKILLNVAASSIDDISYDEGMEVLNYIQKYASYRDEDGVEHNADIIWGVSSKPLPDGVLEVVVVATGFSDEEVDQPASFHETVDITQEVEIEVVKPAEKPQQMVTPMQTTPTSAAAVLEHKSSRYDNIEKELRVPSYVRRADVKFVTDNAGSHKAVYNEEAAQPIEAVDNSLF
ncbi:MAG: cell division FtsZ family protein [Alistipes sp.]|nr:cell division FtsZ family protein [Alistipes sp.]